MDWKEIFKGFVEGVKGLATRMSSKHLLGAVGIVGIVSTVAICTQDDKNTESVLISENESTAIPDSSEGEQ